MEHHDGASVGSFVVGLVLWFVVLTFYAIRQKLVEQVGTRRFLGAIGEPFWLLEGTGETVGKFLLNSCVSSRFVSSKYLQDNTRQPFPADHDPFFEKCSTLSRRRSNTSHVLIACCSKYKTIPH